LRRKWRCGVSIMELDYGIGKGAGAFEGDVCFRVIARDELS